jgi:hypothetical protein
MRHTIKGSMLLEQETSCCLFTKESDVTGVINSLNTDDSADSSQFFRSCRNLGNPSRFQGNPRLARVGSCLATCLVTVFLTILMHIYYFIYKKELNKLI